MSEARDRLIDALAECIVARQGLPNREQARLVLAEIEAQGWRLEPPQEAPDEIEKLRAQIVASENLCLAAAGEIDRLKTTLREITDHFASVMDGPMIRGAGVEFKNGVEGIPTIAKARAALGEDK